MTVSRREFLVGCSAAIAAMAGSRIGQLAFASEAGPLAATDEILVSVFLRGGMDGLSLLTPFDDAIYRQKRGGLAIPTTGDNKAIVLDPQNNTFTSSIGLHPAAQLLSELYQAKSLAFVHACGLDDDTRSHFDAMDYIERGTPGNKGTSSGWLARHLQSMNTSSALLPVVAADSAPPTSLLTAGETVAMRDPRSFSLSANYRYNHNENRTMFEALQKFYPEGAVGPLSVAGSRTVETMETLQGIDIDAYVPTTGVAYPGGSFGDSLKTIAQTIKLDLGLRIATVDFGGWDTHENQGRSGEGYFAGKIGELAQGLYAFYNDLPNFHGKLTVVVQSEFGRRLGANDSDGTDHGHGNVMTVLGGNVNGGKIYGNWPGLLDLDQNQDLRITTDFRTVLGEIVTKRMGNNKLGQVFPGLTAADYQPLGLLNGTVPGAIDFSTAQLQRDAVRRAQDDEYRLYLPMLEKC